MMLSTVCRNSNVQKLLKVGAFTRTVRCVAGSAVVRNLDEDLPVEMEDPYHPVTKRCFLCGVRVDYKNVQLLSQFVSSYTGAPISQKLTGLCDEKYDTILKSIKMSQRAGFMAFRTKETTFLEDHDLTGTVLRSQEFKSGSKSLPSTKGNTATSSDSAKAS